MTNADEIVLIGRLLDRDPLDCPEELVQSIASYTDMNTLRSIARQSGLIRTAEMAPARVVAG